MGDGRHGKVSHAVNKVRAVVHNLGELRFVQQQFTVWPGARRKMMIVDFESHAVNTLRQ
ncbi:MAG: hypothetical protein K9H16_14195 [Bacteroidales bacterium]|nr:hypothetical protein [Bacteroidales bacterium]